MAQKKAFKAGHGPREAIKRIHSPYICQKFGIRDQLSVYSAFSLSFHSIWAREASERTTFSTSHRREGLPG